ncbi:MAG: hypothetical protein RBG13Loki_2727 [Promethearchaeota archaeon CR_4]|nr:MAG: hypothetical protein RBG13Loki_2727 [Candidatus Lokiarchaeota archaeon CR_4]
MNILFLARLLSQENMPTQPLTTYCKYLDLHPYASLENRSNENFLILDYVNRFMLRFH